MATPLQWHAYKLNHAVFGSVLYRHLLTMNYKTERFELEGKYLKLIPFYLGSANVLFICSICIYIPIKYLIDGTSVPFHFALFNLQLASILLLSLCLILCTIHHGHELFTDCFNLLFNFDRKLRRDTSALGSFIESSLPKLLIIEISKLLRGRKSDTVGIMMIGIVILVFLGGAGIGVIGSLAKLDPLSFVFRNFGESFRMGYVSLSIRMFVTTWGALESARSCAVVFLPAVSLLNVYASCFRVIARLPPNMNALKLYTEVQCITHIGMNGIRDLAGALMSVGFILSVVGTWIVFMGWKVLPKEMYILMSLVTMNIYIVVSQTLPKIVATHEYSAELLKYRWPIKVPRYWCLDLNNAYTSARGRYVVWRRMLNAQKPVTFYFGSAFFDKDTETSFYYNIIENTVNIILVT